MNLKKRLLLILITTWLLSACGQTGPLYLPGEEPPIHVEEDDEY
ncbi:MAG: LPS translocon maturation chaperone LptM [Gammaproteobacteria bacterium]